MDPPKETAPEAIRALMDHGVEIKILTGDNPIVAQKVCKDVGLPIKGILRDFPRTFSHPLNMDISPQAPTPP